MERDTKNAARNPFYASLEAWLRFGYGRQVYSWSRIKKTCKMVVGRRVFLDLKFEMPSHVFIRGCPHITSAAGGREGGKPNADDC